MNKVLLFFSIILVFSVAFSTQTYLFDQSHIINKNYSILLNMRCENAQNDVGVIFRIFVLNTLNQDPYDYLLNKFNSYPKNNESIFILLVKDKMFLRTISSKQYKNVIDTNKAFNANLWSRREYSAFLYYYVESLMKNIYDFKGIKFKSMKENLSLGASNGFGTLIIIGILIGGGGIFYHRLTHDIHKCPNCKSKMTLVYRIEKIVNSKKVYELKYKCDKCGYEYVKIKGR